MLLHWISNSLLHLELQMLSLRSKRLLSNWLVATMRHHLSTGARNWLTWRMLWRSLLKMSEIGGGCWSCILIGIYIHIRIYFKWLIANTWMARLVHTLLLSLFNDGETLCERFAEEPRITPLLQLRWLGLVAQLLPTELVMLNLVSQEIQWLRFSQRGEVGILIIKCFVLVWIALVIKDFHSVPTSGVAELLDF